MSDKFLDYNGLQTYDGLIKDYIGEHGGEEVFIGATTPSTDEYKVWINPDGETSPVYTKAETDGLLADKQHTLTAGTNITIANNVISASGEPNAYIKSASVDGRTLTLTNKDDTTTAFTDSGSVVSVSDTGTATAEVHYITIDGVEKKLAGGGSGGSYTAGNGIDITNNTISVKGTTASPLTVDAIGTGTGTNNYFQSQKFRGEGNANTYYHAIDFGYSGHNQVDFHEYGGAYNFYKNTAGTAGGKQLIFAIGDGTLSSRASSGTSLLDVDSNDIKYKNTSLKVTGENDGTNWTSLTVGGVTKAIPSGGSGGEPASYIKDASVNDKTLTLTKKDNTTVTFTDTGSVVSASNSGTATDEVSYITIDGVEKKIVGASVAGVSSLGGATGTITLGSGLTMSNNELSASASSNVVTTDTDQDISGSKKFNSDIKFGKDSEQYGYGLVNSYNRDIIRTDRYGHGVIIGDRSNPMANTSIYSLNRPKWYANSVNSIELATADQLIPQCPTTTDGTFTLKCTVTNGTPTYTWVQEV